MKSYTILTVFTVSSFLVAWSPIKPLAYTLPAFFLFLLVFFYRDESYSSVLFRIVTAFILVLLGIIFYSYLNAHFILQNGLLAVGTYSWIVIFLALPFKKQDCSKVYAFFIRWAVPMFILQAFIGFIQAIYGFLLSGSFDLSNGDHVEGTIHLPLPPTATFSNVIFAFNLIVLFLLLIPHIFQSKRHLLPVLFFGFLVILLASVVHLILFLCVSLLIAYLVTRPRLELRGFLLRSLFRIGLISIPVIGAVLLSANLSNLSSLGKKLSSFESPKTKVLKYVFTELPDHYPTMPWLGIGPGQFSSRASLIGSSYYFGGLENPTKLPILSAETSWSMNKYLMPEWIWVTELPFSAGSTLKPYSSWISVISEQGLLAFGMLIFLLIRILLRCWRKSRDDKSRMVNFSILSVYLFYFLSGFQEHYWEIPQVIVLGLLGVILMDRTHNK